jgi:adenylate cyclase
LAAILAADVVGYSRLIGADEPGTLAKLAALRSTVIDPQMAAHGGRVFKTTGDGLLAEFASGVQAVQCAIAIQRAMRTQDGIELRIGLHSADVVIQPDGDLLGDGVNVAARLEGLAEPGGICISGRVREALAEMGDLEQALELAQRANAEGYPRPITVHYLVQLGRMDDARAVAAELRAAELGYTLASARTRLACYGAGHRERRLASLRAAGIPE